LCEAISETTSPAGAEPAPSATQPTQSQADQADRLCRCSGRAGKPHKPHSIIHGQLVILGARVLYTKVRAGVGLKHFKQRRGWRKSLSCSGSLSPIISCIG